MNETFLTVKKGLFKKSVGLRFDMRAFFLLHTEHNININKEQKQEIVNNQQEFITKQIHCAAMSYCIEHSKKAWFKYEDVKKWIGRISFSEMQTITKIIVESGKVVKDHADKIQKDIKKKK